MVIALVFLLGGVAVMSWAGVSHDRHRQQDMDERMGMVRGVPAGGSDEAIGALTDRAVGVAGHVVDHMDHRHFLERSLERARIPLRPGEFVIVVAGGLLTVAALLMMLTHSVPVAAAGCLGATLVVAQVLKMRVNRRRKAFEAQLPDALSLVASSLTAGHTFLRAVQVMCVESGPPMSEEIARVVAESSLGDPVVDSLERMAARLQIRDLEMVVQAMRIQQTVGGRLADLLHTLADVIRARGEVRREVQVLTAEGRMSAYVLTGLVPFLFLMIQILNPGYAKYFFGAPGVYVLLGCGASVLAGLFVILRMVKIKI